MSEQTDPPKGVSVSNMKVQKVFGRITGTKEEVKECLSFFDEDEMLACYERADDGCSRDHCHFIAQKEYKNLKNLREAFSYKCKQVLGETLRYSMKEYEEEKDAEAYLCKGHKKDGSIGPDVFINTYGINVQEAYERFHKVARNNYEKKQTKNIWKSVIQYIEETDPGLFSSEFTRATQIRIASHMYDWYLLKERIIQGKYVQQMVITTIIANKWKSKTIKKGIINTWCDDISYWDGLAQRDYEEVTQAFEEL